ncbi:ATP-binding cassette domain-containing protein [Marinobacterium mangrovicola]|uniref:Putative ABC transport system ATP-binding protein n=1 Tax=Marinobacterium mangrovicola TaxID=1476959 RepID=A0A4R1GJ54_9GAMM|nr:ATP-binding cassette domain-containing protein [Marinobacterium mangrovicola]TCK08397.1 putative ABC transport system ATP-binding protein [Marinobacterium mangrovicola]
MSNPAKSDGPAISISELSFRWPKAARPLLEIPRLTLEAGESLFLQGASGSGKSTLLNLISGVQSGYTGSISVCGEPLERLSMRKRDQLRANRIGLVFQQFNLLPWLSPLENVVLGCRFSAQRRKQAARQDGSVEAQALRLLGELGLESVGSEKRATSTLSIGQQQRVAACRALIGNPPLIIADEPTSSLDSDHRDRFIELLLTECERSGAALLFVSHDRGLAKHFHRAVNLEHLAQPTQEDETC